MRVALSIVLAGLLVLLHVKVVLAQAQQQQSQTAVHETPDVAPRDSTRNPILIARSIQTIITCYAVIRARLRWGRGFCVLVRWGYDAT